MAQLFVVPKDDYKVLRKYLFGCCGMSTILVPEEVLESQEFPEDAAAKLRTLDGMEVNYDFGGDPDIFLDDITSKDQYSQNSLVPDLAYEEE